MHPVLPGPASNILIHLETYAFLQWLKTAEEDDPEAETSPADIPEDQQKVSEHSEQRLLSRSTQGLI